MVLSAAVPAAHGSEPKLEQNFGHHAVSGDFNGDGFDDLAIGAPGEDVIIGDETRKDAGLVNVLYGARGQGLTGVGQVWHQNKSGVKGAAEKEDQFGSALAAGSFDGYGPQDLAIGNPADEDGATGGSVNVLYGDSVNGLSDLLDQLLGAAP